MTAPQVLTWHEDGRAHSATWRSANGAPPPTRVVVADDRMTAATAHRLARTGTAVLWRGDYHNGRRLLTALGRRMDRRTAPTAPPGGTTDGTTAAAFHLHRQHRAHRARVLGMLLIPFEDGHRLALRRAPDVTGACLAAYGPAPGPAVSSLRELLGVIGADQWRRTGVEVPALGARIHPHHGVFSPVRGEYVDLVARAPLPAAARAMDIGTGTGVLAAVLARRGVRHVVATDRDPRALACAADNLTRLGLSNRVELVATDLFPPGRAPLVVCNPPWLPGRAAAPLERAVYDPGGRMLGAFLTRLPAHLEPDGEGWLIMSDLAERLGLRAAGELEAAFGAAGLRVAGRLDTRPRHPRASDPTDPLHTARAGEITSLWRLTRA